MDVLKLGDAENLSDERCVRKTCEFGAIFFGGRNPGCWPVTYVAGGT